MLEKRNNSLENRKAKGIRGKEIIEIDFETGKSKLKIDIENGGGRFGENNGV